MKKVFCAFLILSVSACLSAQTTVSSFSKLGYIKQDTATISSATPAMTMDPLCEKSPWITPYAYCLNNPVKYIDPNGEDVYLLFYIVGNSRGDEAFKAAAQTRKEAIESRKNFNSETASISPLYEGSKQMSTEGWGSFNFNWKEGASMSFYGCNTGRDVSNGSWVGSFARNVSG